jgi:hypothetical protein
MSGDREGWAVLREAVARARSALGGRLVAAYAVGSLTHGGFAPAVSDVDGVLIVDRADAAVAAAVRAVTVEGDLGARLSLFWGDWATFAAPPPTARLPPIVRLDLLRSGVPVLGAPVPDGVEEPAPAELIAESAAFAAQRLAAVPDAEALVAQGRRPLTKTVLFPVRFLATAYAGLAGGNHEAVAWYVASGRPHAALAQAALAWRTQAPGADAVVLVAAHLRGLYREAIDAYKNHPDVPAADRERLAALRI